METYLKEKTGQTQPMSLEIPQLEGVPGMVGMYFSTVLSVASLLRDPEILKYPAKIYYSTSLIISLIPNEQEREKLRNKLSELNNAKIVKQAEIRKVKPESLDFKEKEICLLEASIETIGYTMQFFDKFLGLTKENKVGFYSVDIQRAKIKDD